MSQQIADYLVEGFFDGQRRSFAETVLTYNVQQLAASPREYVVQALDQWALVSGIVFVETDGPAQITFRQEGNVSATYFDIRDGVIHSADVVQSHWMSAADWRSQVQNWMHEIGHALGLGHPGPYNGSNATPIFEEDSTETSIMSYSHTDKFILNPQEADVLAIWQLYGTPEEVNPGDTEYHIDLDEHMFIVDTSGNDTVFVKTSYVMPQDIENLVYSGNYNSTVEIVGNSLNNIITLEG